MVELLVRLTKKNGIVPEMKATNPPPFDVRQLNSNNIRSIASYVTKYDEEQ
jgi:hypothetical protein